MSAFKHDFWGRDMNAENSHKSWRPLTILTFQLNHMAAGVAPALYHGFNVGIHAAVCASVVQLGRVTSGGDLALSALAGAIFAVHPVHVEAVTGVVGRADELGTLFCILAFISYSQLLKACAVLGLREQISVDGIIGWSVAFCVLAWLAFLSKEVTLTLLGVVAAYDLAVQPWRGAWLPIPAERPATRGRGHGVAAMQSSWLPLIALALRCALLLFCGGVYLGLRALLTADSGRATLDGSALLRRAENPFALLHGVERLRSMLYLPAYYGGLLLWPQWLCCE